MHLSIGDLARITGAGVETIRYYEKVGLLAVPERTAGGQRTYTLGHLRRLGLVRRARHLGFSIHQIRALLTLLGRPDSDSPNMEAVAREHLEDVDHRLLQLHEMRHALAAIVEGCRQGQVQDGLIAEALLPDLTVSRVRPARRREALGSAFD
jgi:DNA-binding transcriptional MerR regulator